MIQIESLKLRVNQGQKSSMMSFMVVLGMETVCLKIAMSCSYHEWVRAVWKEIGNVSWGNEEGEPTSSVRLWSGCLMIQSCSWLMFQPKNSIESGSFLPCENREYDRRRSYVQVGFGQTLEPAPACSVEFPSMVFASLGLWANCFMRLIR